MTIGHRRRSILGGAARGAVAGLVATWVMDLVTTGMLEGQSNETTERERAARPNGQSTVANLLDRIEAQTRTRLDDGQRAMASQVIHYLLGIVPGALYGAARSRIPPLGAARGLAYGVVVWAVNDEYLNTALGLAGPFEAYPIETHWRGLVGHAVLGMVTDTGIELLGG